jgi:DNA-binding MarR family transcriptional regulator
MIIGPVKTERVAIARADGIALLPTAPEAAGKQRDECQEAFCRQLERLSRWKRRYMPILDMPQGGDVLIWLLKGGARRRPLKDLYQGSRFSEPTIRLVLKAMVNDGFIAIERHPDDQRVRTVLITPKLVAAVRAYITLLRDGAWAPGVQPAAERVEAESSSAFDRPPCAR